MSQAFTREKLSIADSFGNPIYIGVEKTTIHTVPANSQDTITLYLKFGRVSRCEVTLFRSDGTNDYELEEKYLGANGTIVPVEIKNVQAGNTIKAQLSGASPNTTVYVTSGEKVNQYAQVINRNSTYELALYDNKFQTGTPIYLTVGDFNWGTYTAPSNFQYCSAFKYFPDTCHLVLCLTSGTGAGWWVIDIYENKVVFYSNQYRHDVTQSYGYSWVGNKMVMAEANNFYVIDFADVLNPTLTTTASTSQTGYYPYNMGRVSDTIVFLLSSDISYPLTTWMLNANNTVTWKTTDSTPYLIYTRWAGATFADGNYYLANFDGGGNYYGQVSQIDTATGAITSVYNGISITNGDSRYTCKVVACPERNEFWMFNTSNGANSIYKVNVTAVNSATGYVNTRDIANSKLEGRCFYDAVDDLIYVQGTGNNWYGWDPDTQLWQKDNVIFTDVSWNNNNYGYANSLGTLNNGTNNLLYGCSSYYLQIRNLDTGAESFVSSQAGRWHTAKHIASSRVYTTGEWNGYICVYNLNGTTGTPSLQQNFYAQGYGNWASHTRAMQVDQTNNKLYYADGYSRLNRCSINASTGDLSYDALLINSPTSYPYYNENVWVVDTTNNYYYYSNKEYGYLSQFNITTGSTTPVNVTWADLGILSGLPNYISSFAVGASSSSSYYGLKTARYDPVNNYMYLSCKYNNGTNYFNGVLKLDLDQFGVTNSSVYAGFVQCMNSSDETMGLSEINDNKLVYGSTQYYDQYVVDLATMTSTLIPATYATGTIYGRTYDSTTSGVYYSDSNGRVEGQKYGAPANESPVTPDFNIENVYNYSQKRAIMGSDGSNAHSDADFSHSTSAQRAELDITKGNSAIGYLNRATTTI